MPGQAPCFGGDELLSEVAEHLLRDRLALAGAHARMEVIAEARRRVHPFGEEPRVIEGHVESRERAVDPDRTRGALRVALAEPALEMALHRRQVLDRELVELAWGAVAASARISLVDLGEGAARAGTGRDVIATVREDFGEGEMQQRTRAVIDGNDVDPPLRRERHAAGGVDHAKEPEETRGRAAPALAVADDDRGSRHHRR